MSFQNQPTECDCGCDRRRREAIAGEARPTPVEPEAPPSQWMMPDWRHAKWCEWERGSETNCNCGLDAFRRNVNRRRLAVEPDGLPLDVLREALKQIADAHSPDPDGGQGYTDKGYADIDPACLVCGTSDEYAVPWPCFTRTTADAALARLASTPSEAKP